MLKLSLRKPNRLDVLGHIIMTNSSINRESYNLVAANYAEDHGEALVWQPELDKFIGLLSSPESVLDLGCGNGDETVYSHRKTKCHNPYLNSLAAI
jgi:ubiquinone/menaquinone biosynthesis C-methylase UbiE